MFPAFPADAKHNDVIQANKQYRQLIRRHGRATASRAFRQASEIVGEWAQRRSYHGCLYERMRRTAATGVSATMPPTWLAAQYLLAVPMATLLASPDWKALALHPQGNAAFVAEVRRTIDPDYVWKPYPYWRYIEPIARTLLEGREDAEGLATLAEYRRTHGRPDPPSEIIQSGELCQDNRDEGVAAVSVDLTHRRSGSCPGASGGLRRDTGVVRMEFTARRSGRAD